MSATEFEDGISATNLLPGPASTQLAIFCAFRLRGRVGALIGGICFIVPGLVIILALSAVFLAADPPLWVLGAAAGAGAAVPAGRAERRPRPGTRQLAQNGRCAALKVRWLCYFLAGGTSAATIGPFLVLVLLGCGLIEIAVQGGFRHSSGRAGLFLLPAATMPVVGGLAALSWVALKVGALSYGGGFVIIPLMQHDAVVTYHWMTGRSSSMPWRSAKSLPGRWSRPSPWSATPPRWSRRRPPGRAHRLRPLLLLHHRRRIPFRPAPRRSPACRPS